MTSSRRARRRRRQARTARLARREPLLEETFEALTGHAEELAWQMTVLSRNIAASFSYMFNYISKRYGKGTVAAMPSWGGYDDRFAEKDDAALALGSVTGIRYWSVGYGPFHDDTGKTVVQLKGARARWLPGENTAECNGHDRHNAAQIPVRECGCGFWAYWAEDPGGGTTYVSQPDVAGMVEGWGRYRAGTRGFRCAKAKLLAVCVQGNTMGEQWRVACEQALAAVYKVPVYSSVATMMKAFPPSRSPAPEPPELYGPRPRRVYTQRGAGGGGGGGGYFAPGGNVSGSGYSRGGWLPPPTAWQPATEVAACPCGVRYGLSPGASVACRCGVHWYWDGLVPPVMTRGPSPAEALKKLEQKKKDAS